MKVRFCGDCGRLILADFLYCPYCGAKLAPQGPALDEALATPFRRLERDSDGAALRGLEEASRRVAALEAEMEALIAQAEASRRS